MPFKVDEVLASRWIAGLGTHGATTKDVIRQGLVPPQALVGNTIYLVSCHYDIAGGVYWREQVTIHTPLKLGEASVVEGSIRGIYWRDGRRYWVMASRTVDGEGRAVATSRSSGLLRYRRDEAPPTDTEPPAGDEPGPDRVAAVSNPHRETLRALRDGQAFRSGDVRVTLEMMRALAGGEERNPIHTDEEAARQAGLSAPIAGGPHVLAFAMETVMASLGPESLIHGAHIDVRWVSPVPAGSSVRAEATVAVVSDAGVELDVGVLCDGRPAMVGRFSIPL